MRNTLVFICLLFTSMLAHAELYVTNVGSLNFRSSPSYKDDNNVIRQVSEGTQLEFVEDAGNYIKVKIRAGQINAGEEGYVWKNFTESVNTYDGINEDKDSVVAGQPLNPMCSCSTCRRSSKFGMRTHPLTKRRKLHSGCDMAAPKGTMVYAAAAGKVKFAGVNGGYGKSIDIEHRGELRDAKGKSVTNKGYSTRYGHLWKILVSRGQRVEKGQAIGKVDSTGSSTGHHLHFEIATDKGRMDPERFIDVSDARQSCSSRETSDTTVKQ